MGLNKGKKGEEEGGGTDDRPRLAGEHGREERPEESKVGDEVDVD